MIRQSSVLVTLAIQPFLFLLGCQRDASQLTSQQLSDSSIHAHDVIVSGIEHYFYHHGSVPKEMQDLPKWVGDHLRWVYPNGAPSYSWKLESRPGEGQPPGWVMVRVFVVGKNTHAEYTKTCFLARQGASSYIHFYSPSRVLDTAPSNLANVLAWNYAPGRHRRHLSISEWNLLRDFKAKAVGNEVVVTQRSTGRKWRYDVTGMIERYAKPTADYE